MFQPHQAHFSCLGPQQQTQPLPIFSSYHAPNPLSINNTGYEAPSQNFSSVPSIISTTSQVPKEEWILDSGKMNHFTHSLDEMSMVAPYQSESRVLVSNGKTVPILHFGRKILLTNPQILHLNQVFHAPCLSKNLVSVSQLCFENDVIVEFNSNSFLT